MYVRKLFLIENVSLNILKAENIREEDLEGIREHTTRQITNLEEKIVALQLDTQRQDEIIENKLKSVKLISNNLLNKLYNNLFHYSNFILICKLQHTL